MPESRGLIRELPDPDAIATYDIAVVSLNPLERPDQGGPVQNLTSGTERADPELHNQGWEASVNGPPAEDSDTPS